MGACAAERDAAAELLQRLAEHQALREEARRRWGAGFTLRRYDDAVLAHGAPPVRFVRELMFDLPIG